MKLQYSSPDWFKQVIDTRAEVRQVTVADCSIEYYLWGQPGNPLLVLVHGNSGHANWWDFIAPMLADGYCICALHLSGMGNSGYRSHYDLDTYAREIVAVAEDAGYMQDISIVGHSLGGFVTLRAAKLYPDRVKAIAVLDSPLIPLGEMADGNDKKFDMASHRVRAKHYYPDFDSVLERFRLIPEQPCKNTFLLDHVAHHSIRHFEQGWSWKFDPQINALQARSQDLELGGVQCQFAYIYGESSMLVPPHNIPALHELLADLGPVIAIPGAHHHLMLDEPFTVVEALKSIMATWLRSP